MSFIASLVWFDLAFINFQLNVFTMTKLYLSRNANKNKQCFLFHVCFLKQTEICQYLKTKKTNQQKTHQKTLLKILFNCDY